MRTFKPGRIKERRVKLKLTQAELAEKAGMQRVYLVLLENGRKVPKATTLCRIASALRVNESYFFETTVSNAYQ